uniref:Uncharacterized protein n=1 Tax=Arundo donax TaxID=35708 RepID=A0A0A9B162_ARUDO
MRQEVEIHIESTSQSRHNRSRFYKVNTSLFLQILD